MGQTPPPPAPPGGRKPTPSQGPPIHEDYGDYNDFEQDATNVNQIPLPGQPGGVPSVMPVRPSGPQMSPPPSPQLSPGGPPQNTGPQMQPQPHPQGLVTGMTNLGAIG